MIRINLLPVREARRRADVNQQLGMLGIVTVVALLIGGWAQWSIQSDIDAAKARVARTNAQIKRFQPQLEQVKAYKAKKATVQKKLDVIEELDNSRSGPVRVLDELSTRSPERLWLTRLEASGNKLTLMGSSLDNEIVAQFLTKLSESEYFKKVELKGSELQTKGAVKVHAFKIQAQITSPEREAKLAEKAMKAKKKGPKKKQKAKKGRRADSGHSSLAVGR